MSAPAARGGFALPAVLVVVAILSLVFLSALTGFDSLSREARLSLEDAKLDQAAASLQARAAFLAATEPLGATAILVPEAGRGRGPTPSIPLDGSPTRSERFSGLEISLQDEAGLVNLAQLPRPGVEALFAALAAHPDDAVVLADRYGDFVDPDGLKRAHGAEAPDYRAAGLAPPPNRPLASVAELTGLLGWSEKVSQDAWRTWSKRLTSDPTSGTMNVNTASPETLAILAGITLAQARAAVEARERAPFASLQALGNAVGARIPSDAERSYGAPNGRFTLSVRAKGGETRRSRIVLTPEDPTRPIWYADLGPGFDPTPAAHPVDKEQHVLPDPPA